MSQLDNEILGLQNTGLPGAVPARKAKAFADANFRLKRGHTTFPRGFFLTCLVHAQSGETQVLVSGDGFRTARRVCTEFDMSSQARTLYAED
jgi:hypothetical protein